MYINGVFARIERGQCADLGKGYFCVPSIILGALLCVILHFEGTMGKITYIICLPKKKSLATKTYNGNNPRHVI